MSSDHYHGAYKWKILAPHTKHSPSADRWQSIVRIPAIVLVTSHATSRIFLGAAVCWDQEMIELMPENAVYLMPAFERVRSFHPVALASRLAVSSRVEIAESSSGARN